MKSLVFCLALVVVVSAGERKKPCDSSPCQNDGKCKNGLLLYYCDCKRGFWGRNCEKEVKRACELFSPCQNGGECVNKRFFSYRCKCPPGYTGKNCQHAPCDAEPCMNDGECSNGEAPNGGYSCTCANGFQGNNCEEVVPPSTYDCTDNNPCSQENTAKNGYYFPAHEKNQFIQCSEHAQCWVMNCGPGTEWNQEAMTCDWPQ